MAHPPGWSGGSDGKDASQQGPRVQPTVVSSDKSHDKRVAASSKQQNEPRSGSDTWPSVSPPHPESSDDINAHDTQPIPITRIIAKAWTVPVPPARPPVSPWYIKLLRRLLGVTDAE
jgi:hypothetical protein